MFNSVGPSMSMGSKSTALVSIGPSKSIWPAAISALSTIEASKQVCILGNMTVYDIDLVSSQGWNS